MATPLHDNDNLAFDLMVGEMSKHLGSGAPNSLGMDFANLAGDADMTFGGQDSLQLLQQFDKSERRLVEDGGVRNGGQSLDGRLTTFFVREETEEQETIARETAIDKCRDKGSGARQTLDVDAMPDSFADKEEARIADARSAGIGHHSDIVTSHDKVDNTANDLMFIEDVIRLHGGVDLIVLHKDTRGTRILGQDKIDRLEHLDGAESHIGQITDRGRDEKEFHTKGGRGKEREKKAK